MLAGQKASNRPLPETSNPVKPKQVLVVRTDFSDLPGDPRFALSSVPLTAAVVTRLAEDQIGAYYLKSSYGRASLAFTVSPQLYRLPQTALQYATVSFQFALYDDAQKLAKADYRLSDYDIVVVLFAWLGSIPGSQIQFGGLTILGTGKVCVNGEFDFRVVAHELGHAYGLYHANLWQTSDGNPIASGGSLEYGDLFDTMGANFNNELRTDFNPWFKYQLNWLADDQVITVTNNGTYRIHRFDDAGATGALALKVVKDAHRSYWVGCRRNFTENPTMAHGAYVIWGYNEAHPSDLLALGENRGDVYNAALAIGDSLADPEANLTITPVAEGGATPSQYLDVRVTLGPPPAIVAQPQPQEVLEGQCARFAVVAAGNPAPEFHWQRREKGVLSWSDLSDGVNYGGSLTSTLLIRRAICLMDGDAFRCVLTHSGGGFNCSRSAMLSVSRLGVATVAGRAGLPGQTDGPACLAQFNSPMGIAIDSAGNAFVADTGNHAIRKIIPDGNVTTWAGLAGHAGSADGVGQDARFNCPAGIAVDLAGNVYVADQLNSTVRAIAPDGLVSTLAGSASNRGGADGIGSAARFNHPSGIVVDRLGNLYVADTGNQTVRKITPDRVVTTLAGSIGASGTIDGLGDNARFNDPAGIAVDTAGNIYIADQRNWAIRKISPSGQVTTWAGIAGVPGAADGSGDGARFCFPAGLVVDAGGNVYLADRNNSTIRMISPDGLVRTLAGAAGGDGTNNGTCGNARFTYPTGVAIDNQGTHYVADTLAHTIRLIRSVLPDPPQLRMSVVAGQLIVSWPASATGFVLETSSGLAAGSAWCAFTGEVAISSSTYWATNRMDTSLGLFRLHRQ